MSRPEYFFCLGVFLTLGSMVPMMAEVSQQAGTESVSEALKNYGYERIGNGKYAVVVNSPRAISWYGAYIGCRSHLQGASLFTVDDARDSKWLGERINFLKDRVTGASKFWVGLISRSSKGPLLWLSGQVYKKHPDVVLATDYDDRTKRYAWAVPNGDQTRLKYELVTVKDEADAYVCQYKRI